MENKMTDEEIMKALESCIVDDFYKIRNALCAKCAYCQYTDCKRRLQQDALDLINRKDAEKETLRDEIERLNKILENRGEICKLCEGKYTEKIKRAKAKAIKEFAERLEKEIIFWQDDIHTNEYDCHKYDFVFERIYEIIKEMVGD